MNAQEHATLSLLWSCEAIAARVKELAIQISRDYGGKDLLLVGVLKGAFVFLADLMRARAVRIVLLMSVGVFFFNHGLNNWLPEILRSRGMAPETSWHTLNLDGLYPGKPGASSAGAALLAWRGENAEPARRDPRSCGTRRS